MAGLTVCVLGVVRCANPAVVGETAGVSSVPLDSSVLTVVSASKTESMEVVRKTGLHTPYSMPVFKEADGRPLKSKIYSVPGFGRTFPDLQDVHIVAARKWGVSPVEDREEAELRKDELVYVGSNPYYTMDKQMSYSIPYLVPRASDLLQKISRNFFGLFSYQRYSVAYVNCNFRSAYGERCAEIETF